MMAITDPQCELYLKLPPLLSREVKAAFEQTIASVDVACVLLAQGDTAPDLAQASEIVRRTQEFGIAVLVYAATIYGRYHYSVDGLMSIVLAAMVCWTLERGTQVEG